MPVRDLESCFPAVHRPLRFLANRGANGIDGLVSLPGSARRPRPRGRTFGALTGDLGLYHEINGLLAFRRLGLEPTIIALNNGGGGIFDFRPSPATVTGYEELFGTPTGLDLEKVASLYGLPFTRVWLGSTKHWRHPASSRSPDRPRNVELHRRFSLPSGAKSERNRSGPSPG